MVVYPIAVRRRPRLTARRRTDKTVRIKSPCAFVIRPKDDSLLVLENKYLENSIVARARLRTKRPVVRVNST